MKLNEYQDQAIAFQMLSPKDILLASDPAYVAKVLGLVGEAGEVAEKYKKIIRDKEGVVSPEARKEIIKELGDVLWYVSTIATYLGASLEEVALTNLDKITSRKERGAQHGSGDNR